MIVLVYYISDHFRQTANWRGKKKSLWLNEKYNEGSQGAHADGHWGGDAGAVPMLQSTETKAGRQRCQRQVKAKGPQKALSLLQTLLEPSLPAPARAEPRQSSTRGGRAQICAPSAGKWSGAARGEVGGLRDPPAGTLGSASTAAGMRKAPELLCASSETASEPTAFPGQQTTQRGLIRSD